MSSLRRDEGCGQVGRTTGGRSGTWATVIANQRLEEAVQIVDFTVGQNFGEGQVEGSRILQVSIFNTLQHNLSRVDFNRVLLDVITIAGEVDSQLKQAMLSYVELPSWSAA